MRRRVTRRFILIQAVWHSTTFSPTFSDIEVYWKLKQMRNLADDTSWVGLWLTAIACILSLSHSTPAIRTISRSIYYDNSLPEALLYKLECEADAEDINDCLIYWHGGCERCNCSYTNYRYGVVCREYFSTKPLWWQHYKYQTSLKTIFWYKRILTNLKNIFIWHI